MPVLINYLKFSGNSNKVETHKQPPESVFLHQKHKYIFLLIEFYEAKNKVNIEEFKFHHLQLETQVHFNHIL